MNVVTYAGQQDVSRQSLERGRGTDEVIFGDLVGDYAAKLDRDVINGPGSGGRHKGIRQSVVAANTVAAKGSGATKITGRQLLTNIHDAVSRINGSRFLPADAIVFTPQRWGWLLDQSDSNGRPLVLSATAYGPNNAVGVGAAAGYGLVGTVAGVPAYTDANVPSTISSSTFGNEDVVIVTRSADLHLWEENGGVPRQFTFEETLGGNLTVKLVAAASAPSPPSTIPKGWQSSAARASPTSEGCSDAAHLWPRWPVRVRRRDLVGSPRHAHPIRPVRRGVGPERDRAARIRLDHPGRPRGALGPVVALDRDGLGRRRAGGHVRWAGTFLASRLGKCHVDGDQPVHDDVTRATSRARA